jgi:hypothetical protein
MKVVYCSKCGTRLAITRKALPKYGRIIDIVEYHKCPDEPVEFNLTPINVPAFSVVPKEGDDKFVQNLNRLQPPPIATEGLKDRRNPENIKTEPSSSAPRTLLDNMKAIHNTTPAHDIGDGPKEE